MYQFFIKRLIDIVISLLAMPFIFLIYIFVFVAIKLEDRGPVFYLDKRYGVDMKEFTMYKFRSMMVKAPDIRNDDGTTYNSPNDKRVTKVGRFIRKTSIDELPQLINVLIGDMSLVGPRPSPLGDKTMYGEKFFEKFKVKPGITGYNQATMRNEATMAQRIENDSYYVENISFKLDVYIVFATVASVLKSKNIYRN